MTNSNKQPTDHPRHPIFNEMTTATLAEVLAIVKLHDRVTQGELENRYDIGTRVKLMMADEGKYGQNVVLQVATALGVEPSYLYRCCMIARTWTPEHLKNIRSRRTCFGRRIEFTHLWLIAQLRVSASRDDLIEEFFREGLTTRQLVKRIAAFLGKPKASQGGQPKSPSAGLASMKKFAADYALKSPVWQEVVFVPIEDVTSNGSDISYFDDLLEAKKSHEELMQQVEANIEKLDKCIRFANEAEKKKRKAKRHPKTTTPSRPSAIGRQTTTKTPTRRRRVIE